MKQTKQIVTMREEIINILTQILELHPEEEYDYNLIATLIVGVLVDVKHRSKQGALDALKILREKEIVDIENLLKEAPLEEDIKALIFENFYPISENSSRPETSVIPEGVPTGRKILTINNSTFPSPLAESDPMWGQMSYPQTRKLGPTGISREQPALRRSGGSFPLRSNLNLPIDFQPEEVGTPQRASAKSRPPAILIDDDDG